MRDIGGSDGSGVLNGALRGSSHLPNQRLGLSFDKLEAIRFGAGRVGTLLSIPILR